MARAGAPELVTVRDWLRHAVSRFNAAGVTFGHGTDNAWDEAVYLILHTLHLPLDRLEPFLDARLTAAERSAVQAVIARRVDDRVPAAYITREAWLGEFRFYVDSRVIIPRSFIAGLLFEHLAPWVDDPGAVHTVLDLCTGSGCLAILAAQAFPVAEIDAVDISADALAVAGRNVVEYGLAGRINLVRGDLFEKVAGKTYDLILSNPPYVTDIAMTALPPEYRHEPELALAGGEDGLACVRRILAAAPRYLGAKGLLVVEVGHNRALVETAFPDLPFTWLATEGAADAVFLLTRADLAGKATRRTSNPG